MKIRDARTGRLRKVGDLDRTDVRFNSGYHDGAIETRAGFGRLDGLNRFTIAEKHFDPAYAEGWVFGCNDALGEDYNGNSADAWSRAKHIAALANPYVAYRRIAVRA